MGEQRRRWQLGIWGLGLGYFVSYTPYSGLTKAASSGKWPGLTGPVAGLEMLPASALATLLAMFGFISVMGWWKYPGRRRCGGRQLPLPSGGTFLSGLCMATIIGTTTLAFTFRGVSIVFMLVLFRGGILILAPLVDQLGRRRVRGFSWAALLLSLAALAVTLAEVNGYQMSLVAGLDVIAYLTSYFFRLRTMTQQAKSQDPNAALRYFVEEQMVAAPALLLALGLLALVGGDALVDVRRGFITFGDSPALSAALIVGLSYAALCIFTTFIFLDQHENTFCIPMHCCSSMLSGVVASFALAQLCDLPRPTIAQLVGSGILMLAILCLAFPALEGLHRGKSRGAGAGLQRLYLFVCSGNTSRSPMAQAFCNDAIARRLGLRWDQLDGAPVRALSAGLTG